MALSFPYKVPDYCLESLNECLFCCKDGEEVILPSICPGNNSILQFKDCIDCLRRILTGGHVSVNNCIYEVKRKSGTDIEVFGELPDEVTSFGIIAAGCMECIEDCVPGVMSGKSGDPIVVVVEPSTTKQAIGPPFQVIHKDDIENKNPETKMVQTYQLNGTVCYACVGDDPNINPITNLNDYIMSNYAGDVLPPNLEKLVAPACLTICLGAGESIDFAGINAAAVAQGVLLPDGTPPTGFVNYDITFFQQGQVALVPGVDGGEATIKKSGSQLITKDADSINASSVYCPKEQTLQDVDCDKFVRGEDPAQVITNQSTTEPAIFRLCACFIPLDLDDNDETVQGAGKV